MHAWHSQISYAVHIFLGDFVIFQFFFVILITAEKKKREERSLQTISQSCVVAETPFPKLGKPAVSHKVARPATTFLACPQAHIS